MIPNSTVLVIGAGASRPYMFPTAAELRNLILERDENLDLLKSMGFTATSRNEVPPETYAGAAPDYPNDEKYIPRKYRDWFEYRIRIHRVDEFRLKSLQEQFRLSEFYSIDRFVAENEDWKQIASLAVSCILLRCEQMDRLEGDWYRLFYNELFAEGKNIIDGNLSIVTFNYDRSLEAYIHRALRNGFNMSGEEAWRIIDQLNIIHVYGDLGSLKEQNKGYVKYGNNGGMQIASERIQLLTPRLQSERRSEVESLLQAASRVVFMGFGFDRLNLGVVPVSSIGKKVYASCYHLSESAKKRAEDTFGRFLTISDRELGNRPVIWGDKTHTVMDFLQNSHALV